LTSGCGFFLAGMRSPVGGGYAAAYSGREHTTRRHVPQSTSPWRQKIFDFTRGAPLTSQDHPGTSSARTFLQWARYCWSTPKFRQLATPMPSCKAQKSGPSEGVTALVLRGKRMANSLWRTTGMCVHGGEDCREEEQVLEKGQASHTLSGKHCRRRGMRSRASPGVLVRHTPWSTV
jgi:hypothetical protein